MNPRILLTKKNILPRTYANIPRPSSRRNYSARTMQDTPSSSTIMPPITSEGINKINSTQPRPIPPTTVMRSFYQRQLPQICVSFTSDEGKNFFRTALAAGHMESFFPLASQLVTQHEPSFCGLATLCTVLNALGVDPKRVWKHPWRWFEQDMLDCCRPLDSIRDNGITLAEFNCLARCNGLDVMTRSPPPANPTMAGEQDTVDEGKTRSLEEFRSNVTRVTRSSSQFMAISFSRASLGQTGSGHFSPIAGYSPSDDRVLVLDVARFKYPSYWVPIEDLYKSMVPIDPASGTPRGYSILSYSPLMINQTNCETCNPPNPPSITRINLNKSSWYTLSKDLTPILKTIQSEPLLTGIGKISELFDHLTKLMNLIQHPSSPLDPTHKPQLLFLFSLAILPNPSTLPPNDLAAGLKALEPELAYLRAQLDALGECCSIENDHNLPKCGCKKSI